MPKADIIGFTQYGYPIFAYVVDGKEYKVRSTSEIPYVSAGSKVEVKYHSGKPTYVQVGENPMHNMALPMIVFGSLGAFVTGYFLFGKIFRHKN